MSDKSEKTADELFDEMLKLSEDFQKYLDNLDKNPSVQPTNIIRGGSYHDDSTEHLSSNSPKQPEQEDRYIYEIQERTRDSSWYRTIQTSGSEYQAILTAESLANRGKDGYSYRVMQKLNGRNAGCIWNS